MEMRSKKEIIKMISEEGKEVKNPHALIAAMIMTLLEPLIDIRDILADDTRVYNVEIKEK